MKRSKFGKVSDAISRNTKRVVILVAIGLLAFTAGFFAFDQVYQFFYNDSYLTYDKTGETVVIEVPKGSSGQQIGELLEEAGLIKNATLFRYKAQFTGDTSGFQYGTYTFTRGMNYSDIVKILQTGEKAKDVTITIKEGWNCRQIAAYLEEKNICMADAFLALCNSTTQNFDYYGDITNPESRYYLLEGYLHPNTYRVLPANGAQGVMTRLLRQTELIFQKEARVKKMNDLGYTVDEVLRMASVIEKEVNKKDDMPKVARVLMNRNKYNYKLWSCDSTLIYQAAMEGRNYVWKNESTGNGPYNSYLRMIAGPICNPSVNAIDAVLSPATGNWLYFLLYDSTTGETRFTASVEEFNKWSREMK